MKAVSGRMKTSVLLLQQDVQCFISNYSISSLDLNAIEGWWHRLKQRLVEQAPDDLERRPEFLLRLRCIGHWMNEHWADDALYLCTNQKERARQGLSPDINGAKYEF